MRLLVLSPRAADPLRRSLMRAVRARGHDVHLAVPERWRDAAGQEQQTAIGDGGGLHVIPVAVSPAADEARSDWHAGTVKRLIRDLRPDLLHLELEPWSPTAATAVRAAKALGIPSVVHVAHAREVPSGMLDRWRQRAVLGSVAGVAAASSAALALWPAWVGSEAGRVIPRQPTEVALPTPGRPSDVLRLGFAGRLVPERGCDLLLRACARLYGQWTLQVAGSGPSQDELEELAMRLGLASRITWLGGLPAPALAAWWAEVDVLVAPLRATPTFVEEHGMLLREAMAREIAVVGSRTGALPDILAETGALVASDDVEGLGAALQHWLAEPDALLAAKRAARRRILAAYTPSAVAEQLEAFWGVVRARARAA